MRYVSSGSWTYSSAQHDIELDHLVWHPAAFVLTTVISNHEGAATLDAGRKAVAPDKPLAAFCQFSRPFAGRPESRRYWSCGL
jgi:hypothetical protein